jgi:hypothetical protein
MRKKNVWQQMWDFVFLQEQLPRWIIRLNLISLAGIVGAPFVFLFALFNLEYRFLFPCGLALYYWIVLFLLSYASYKLFPLNKWIAALLPAIPICWYVYIVIMTIVIEAHRRS